MAVLFTNIEDLDSEEFYTLLYNTYVQGAAAEMQKAKAADRERKRIILNAIIEAASKGRSSVCVVLDSYLSPSIEKFLKAAKIDWEEVSPRRGGFCLSAIKYTFFWDSLDKELCYD